MSPTPERMRIDKWLWAARFYKTRSLAAEEVGKGRVQVNDQSIKPAREIKPGDRVSLRQGAHLRVVEVKALSMVRGPAVQARTLYEETPESLQALERMIEQSRLAPEPALSIDQGRPTKRDRRQMQRDWDQRWSASLD